MLEQRAGARQAPAEVRLHRGRLPQPDRRSDGAARRREALDRRSPDRRASSRRGQPLSPRTFRGRGRRRHSRRWTAAHRVSASAPSRSWWRPGCASAGSRRDRRWIARLMQLKSDGGSCPSCERIILDFCRSATFATHVERVQAAYREQRDRMVAALRSYLPQTPIRRAAGRLLHVAEPAARRRRRRLAGAPRRWPASTSSPGARFFAAGGIRRPGRAAATRAAVLQLRPPEQIDEGVEASANPAPRWRTIYRESSVAA